MFSRTKTVLLDGALASDASWTVDVSDCIKLVFLYSGNNVRFKIERDCSETSVTVDDSYVTFIDTHQIVINTIGIDSVTISNDSSSTASGVLAAVEKVKA